ncbi:MULTISPECIES: phage head-tail joining protein [Ralstonia]|jgi:hypothetical protein|uniref:Uncharacterized protein n=1 Tax=Ralstonia mannitolilytica TaxID=105219 RepID=A0AAD2EPF4_9RALS|nr:MULTISPECIES: hypothetical protein [Ralstonia]MBY4721285.1 hypothetical protein [Ralstonia mannitolilytica]PLT16347.1 hypothetical protein CXP34_19570 [Ralstonia mannitolilytica]QIF08822.1 hypothetical protein G5A69_15095 [Ralstonia mannitolilytica]CAJ0692304.1 hypothetical protein R77591_03896 [Ralstonia mannitolilytica]CAJ0739081.1 hypothetical protein R76696_02278 [Ralstonia mannitolilytica]
MAYAEAQLQALETALAKGERRVSFGDKTVEYRSVDELMAAIREVRRGLLQQAAETGLLPGAPRQIRVTTHKGF